VRGREDARQAEHEKAGQGKDTIPGILARAGQDRVNMQGKHRGHTSTGKGRVLGKPQVCRTISRPGWMAGWRLHRACESRDQGRYGRDTPSGNVEATTSCQNLRVWCPGAMSTRCISDVWPGRDVLVAHVAHVARAPHPVPMLPCVDMESCAHGTHGLIGTMRTIRSLLQPARKPGSTGKGPCRHGRCRETRARGIRVHGSIHRKFEPVRPRAVYAGRARRPRRPPVLQG